MYSQYSSNSSHTKSQKQKANKRPTTNHTQPATVTALTHSHSLSLTPTHSQSLSSALSITQLRDRPRHRGLACWRRFHTKSFKCSGGQRRYVMLTWVLTKSVISPRGQRRYYLLTQRTKSRRVIRRSSVEQLSTHKYMSDVSRESLG